MIQDTSTKAFNEDVVPTLGERQAQVLGVIRVTDAPTNTEIAAILHMPINCITPRVNELRKLGKVIDAGKRPCRITGRLAYTWAINPNQGKLL